LTGCHFNNNNNNNKLLTNGNTGSTNTNTNNTESAEEMVQQYCTSVERSMQKYKEEIRELQSFCQYLEKRVVASNPSNLSVQDHLV